MQIQTSLSSEKDLSKYKKLGYEYVEEEKVVLDSLVLLYRKRLEIAQNHLKSLEELYFVSENSFNPSSTLHGSLISPIIVCLQRDIDGHRQYIEKARNDLAVLTFPIGPRSVVQDIKRDIGLVKPLYSDYEDSCVAASKLPAPSPSFDNSWRIHEEDIRHRQIAARLHPKQKAARDHFDHTYPSMIELDYGQKLLDDHMEYMEQVKKLVRSDTNRRRELSTTVACNANAEKELVDRFSTTDAIAVAYMKLGLEKDRREYRHAPVLNIFTRELEEDRTVVLGREIELDSDYDPAQEMIVACLARCIKAPYLWSDVQSEKEWEHLWGITHEMELDSSERHVHETVSKLRNGYEIGHQIGMLMSNTRTPYPLLNIADERSIKKLKEDRWDRPALVNVMKDVDPRIRGILKACAIAYLTSSASTYEWYVGEGSKLTDVAANSAFHLGTLSFDSSMWQSIEAILFMWDCDLWQPLPDDVEWRKGKSEKDDPCPRRTKRFPAKPGYGSKWVYLEVDENEDVLDMPRNQGRKEWIEVPASRISKMRRKLNI
ncbi:hypothetical protein FRC17_002053 [Serendipita sp. 399]|nr:hypothetical protein FRC17_002053 [Serendipita sp. 399]